MKKILSLKDISIAIKNERQKQNLKQDELAAMSDVSKKFIIELEKGKETVHLNKTVRVMRMLGINIYLKED